MSGTVVGINGHRVSDTQNPPTTRNRLGRSCRASRPPSFSPPPSRGSIEAIERQERHPSIANLSRDNDEKEDSSQLNRQQSPHANEPKGRAAALISAPAVLLVLLFVAYAARPQPCRRCEFGIAVRRCQPSFFAPPQHHRRHARQHGEACETRDSEREERWAYR